MLFQPNVTVEVQYFDGTSSKVVGYLFVTNGTTEGSQDQRWVLDSDYAPLPEKVGAMRFYAPPPELAITSLEAWRVVVSAKMASRGAWENYTYIKVAATSYSSIPDPLPAPNYPSLAPKSALLTNTGFRVSSQIESRWKIQCKALEDWPEVGHMYGTKVEWIDSVGRNLEYWVTLKNYTAPLATAAPVRIKYDLTRVSLGEYLKDAQINWKPGSTFTIANCSYVKGIPLDP